MTDDERYIDQLIAEGEHQRQDFKFEITSARKIARTLVAFANSDGGRLLIGVKDNGRIAGIRSEEEYYMIEAAATMYCKPVIRFDSYRREAEGKSILEILIEPSAEKPHYALDESNRWKAYHRVNDKNHLADYILLQVWKREKRVHGTYLEYTLNEEEVLRYLEQHREAGFDELRSALAMKKRTLQGVLINLVSIGALRMKFNEYSRSFVLG